VSAAAPLDLEAIRRAYAEIGTFVDALDIMDRSLSLDVVWRAVPALLTAYSHEHERAEIYRLGADEKAAACVRLQAERDALRTAAAALIASPPCSDPDCCNTAIKEANARRGLAEALALLARDPEAQ
jgi:hypothetical protein